MLDQTLKSIFQLEPIESGGTSARRGFIYQDHVAVNFLLLMLQSEKLIEVWCETHDDITLIWKINGKVEVEFVQVKELALQNFWSLSRLCNREKTDLHNSLFDKSFNQDRCQENSKFRIITSLPINNELGVLQTPLSSPLRNRNEKKFTKLIDYITKKFGNITSPKGNDITYWLLNVLWQVYSDDEIKIRNNSDILTFLMEKQFQISPTIIEEQIYLPLLNKVQEASSKRWADDPDQKKIKRSDFVVWFEDLIRKKEYDILSGSGKKLSEKMNTAKLEEDYIINALEERRQFRKERLETKYLDFDDLELIEQEVAAELVRLRLDMDNGKIEEGKVFFSKCKEVIKSLQNKVNTKSNIPLFCLDGAMYEITDRCAHRFHKENL